MKITLIQGSPHKQGASNILAEQFQAGAKAAGHEVFVFDAAHAKIGPCLACEYCHTKGGGACCCQKDDMEHLKKLILSSGAVVLATPLYFFNMSAQMKTAVDRLYAFLDKMAGRVSKMALLVAANNPHIMDCIVTNYQSIVNFLGVQNAGMVLAAGCGTPELTRRSHFPQLAYKLGTSL